MPENPIIGTSHPPERRPLPIVAIVACDGFAPFQFSVPCVIFGNFLPGTNLFDLRICAVDDGDLRNEFGMWISTPFGVETLLEADVIVIPFWPDPALKPRETLLDALRRAADSGALIAGLCLGGYPLAYAGLLDGRRASTHWEVVSDFRQRFPNVTLETDALYVKDGSIITSAGTGAGIDCCLNIVRSIYGSQIANRVARRLVIPFFREGQDNQLVPMPIPENTESERIRRTAAYVLENLAERHGVDRLAFLAGMSRRSFTRHFQKATGMGLMDWIQSKRLQKAQELLEDPCIRVEAISELVGFASPVAFRRLFKAEFGASPSEWRRSSAKTLTTSP
jgi:transcriptional regulator GlxA family with amidase domain